MLIPPRQAEHSCLCCIHIIQQEAEQHGAYGPGLFNHTGVSCLLSSNVNRDRLLVHSIPQFPHSRIHLFKKQLLSKNNMPGTVLGIRDIVVY